MTMTYVLLFCRLALKYPVAIFDSGASWQQMSELYALGSESSFLLKEDEEDTWMNSDDRGLGGPWRSQVTFEEN